MTVQYAQPKPSSIAGNGLFANQAIHAGEAVAILDRPLVAVLDYSRLSDTCSHCFAQTHDNDYYQRESIIISACTGCKAVRYCSKVCYTVVIFRPRRNISSLLENLLRTYHRRRFQSTCEAE